MITKQIRISEKAYKELESRKDKTGVNIRRQIDDLILTRKDDNGKRINDDK